MAVDGGQVQRRVALGVVVWGGRRLGGKEQLGLVAVADASGEMLQQQGGFIIGGKLGYAKGKCMQVSMH